MSDGYLFMDETLVIDENQPSRIERVLKKLALGLSIILAAELAWFLGLSPCLPFTHVEVMSIAGLSEGSLLQTAGITSKTSFITLNALAVEKALETIPQVESARVIKRFPDHLSISVIGRSTVAVAFAKMEGKTVPIAFDRFGVVFGIGSSVLGNNLSQVSMPIISGLVFENPSEGMRLPAFLEPFLMDLDSLSRESPALLGALSEIRVQKKAFDGYELVLYPAHHSVRVRIGSQLNEEVLRYMILVLDVLSSKGIEADEIDFRAGTASYRAKEASSG
ncbi:FtsQ-type POTRA domain-containing protein [Treponema sp.]